MAEPNPAAALRHIIDALKALNPSLTDEDVALGMGVRHPALIDWTKGRAVPRGPKRAAMKKYIGGVGDALVEAFARLEIGGADDEVEPFALPPIAS